MRFAVLFLAILGLAGCNVLSEAIQGPPEPAVVDRVFDELCESPTIEQCQSIIGVLKNDADVAKNEKAMSRLENISQETNADLCATFVQVWAKQIWGERRNLRGEIKHPHCGEG